MDGGESLLDTLFDEDGVEGVQDVEMFDVEEGELIEPVPKTKVGESSDVGGNQGNQESDRPNSRHKKKRRNKKKRGSSTGPNVTNVNKFVLDACKRLKERKSYLMYTAVGCLGVAALSDLIKEVDAIQACGGQKTADGKRFRNGGGVLWNIIKTRDPNAYKEIMRKGKEFEKQFKPQLNDKQEPKQQTEASLTSLSLDANQVNNNLPDGLDVTPPEQSQHELLTAPKRASVHDRIRVPVAYDDLLGGEDPKDELASFR